MQYLLQLPLLMFPVLDIQRKSHTRENKAISKPIQLPVGKTTELPKEVPNWTAQFGSPFGICDLGASFGVLPSEKRENVCNDEQDRLAHHLNHPRLRSVAPFAYCLARSYIPDDIVSLESMDRVFFFNLCLQCLSLIQQDVLEAVSFIADEDDLNHSICSDLADNFIV